MTKRNTTCKRREAKPLRLHVEFSVTLEPDEQTLLLAYAMGMGYGLDGGSERDLLRRLLQDYGMHALEEAANQVRYRLVTEDDYPDPYAEEGGAG